MGKWDEKLREVQDTAIKHAVEEMEAAAALTLQTKQERGDRGWLTGMAAKSIGVATRIEQFLTLRSARGIGDGDQDDDKEARELVGRARSEVEAIMKRVKGGAAA